jgi:hypothetical protein
VSDVSTHLPSGSRDRSPRRRLRRTYTRWRKWRADPPQTSTHVWAATFAVVLVGVTTLQAAGGRDTSGSTDSPLVAVTVIGGLAVAWSAFYSGYYFPPLVCALLFIKSLGSEGELSQVRITVLFSGAVAGSTYLAVSIWWGRNAGQLHGRLERQQFDDLRAGLFEIGRRYLAAWALVFMTGVVGLAWPMSGIAGSETFLQQAGGIVVTVDLIALLPGRWLKARRLLHRRRPRPYRALIS